MTISGIHVQPILQTGNADLQHREIVASIDLHHFGDKLVPVEQRDLNRTRSVDYVTIGGEKPGFIDHKAAAMTERFAEDRSIGVGGRALRGDRGIPGSTRL